MQVNAWQMYPGRATRYVRQNPEVCVCVCVYIYIYIYTYTCGIHLHVNAWKMHLRAATRYVGQRYCREWGLTHPYKHSCDKSLQTRRHKPRTSSCALFFLVKKTSLKACKRTWGMADFVSRVIKRHMHIQIYTHRHDHLSRSLGRHKSSIFHQGYRACYRGCSGASPWRPAIYYDSGSLHVPNTLELEFRCIYGCLVQAEERRFRQRESERWGQEWD